jgi:KaiC/GvpD/RAD55 family RecA-like ATPase
LLSLNPVFEWRQLSETLRVPILIDLIPDGLCPGTILLIEFDPDSQWVSVAVTVAVRCLMEARHVAFLAFTMTPSEVALAMSKLGLDVAEAEKSGLLAIEDWYSASLTGGRLETGTTQRAMFERVEGRIRVQSLKVADLSVEWLKTSKTGPHVASDIVEFWPPGSVAISESCSPILRFGDEKSFVEFFESRIRPEEHRRGNLVTLQGITRGIHSDWLYKRMESVCDGIIDLRVAELEGEVKNLLRVRALRGQPHNSKWHAIDVTRNGEAKLGSTDILRLG